MTEQARGNGRRARRPRPTKLYRSVLAASDPRVVLQAERAEGLTDEIATVRLLLRRQLEESPPDLELLIKGMHLLVRMVVAQHQLSDADAAEFSKGVRQAIDLFATRILGEETADDREARPHIEVRPLLGEPGGSGSGRGAAAEAADGLGGC